MIAVSKNKGLVSLGLLVLMPVSLAIAMGWGDDYRLWKDTTGKYQVDAVLVSQTETHVTLKKRDGYEIRVAKDKLCDEDLEYLNLLNEASDDSNELEMRRNHSEEDEKEDEEFDSLRKMDSGRTANRARPANKVRTAPVAPKENPDQIAIRKLASEFFEDLRTDERTGAKSLLTDKAQLLVEQKRSALPQLPSPDKGTRAIRVGKIIIKDEVGSVIVTVLVGRIPQKTLLEFKKVGQQWRVQMISASRGDAELTIDFESPYEPKASPKDSGPSFAGAPMEISGLTLDGRRVSLSDYKGKVVLIDFWATWCGPCVKELPNVYENYVKYHERGFEVIAISLDRDMSELQKFVVEKNPPWPVLADHHPNNPESMSGKYKINLIPTMLLVGRDGSVLDANCRGERLGARLAEIFGP